MSTPSGKPAPRLKGIKSLVKRMFPKLKPVAGANKEPVYFLHLGKNAGTQVTNLTEQINQNPKETVHVVKQPHDVALLDIPPDARFFFSIRSPVSRFQSGFYSRKRKGAPRTFSEWTADEAIAFATFEHANDLAEALFEEGPRGHAAAAAMGSISHVALNQVVWFRRRGFFLQSRPPVWILRVEKFDDDLRILGQRLGLKTELKIDNDPVRSHKNNYDDIPKLSEKAVANLRRWFVQDLAFYDMCCDWLDRESNAANQTQTAKQTQS